MSLQVCYCGWSKVTTVHGLRTHQGMKGCTPKSQQQYFQDFVGATAIQLDVKLKVQTSFKADTTDYYSDSSFQVCHCGWSKVTTYKGLRIHQGKMRCTPKGMRIPKEEQYKWNKQQEAEVDHRNTTERVVVKKKDTDSRAVEYCSIDSRTDYGATVKEEPKSHLYQQRIIQAFAVSQPSFQRDTKSKSGQKLQDLSTDMQMNRNVKEPPTLVPVVRPKQKHREGQAFSQMNRQLVREHPASMNLGNVVRPKEENLQNQIPSQNTDSRAVEEYWSVKSSSSNETTAAALKEEPRLSPQPSLQRTTKSSHQMQDSSTDVKVKKMVNEPPTAPTLVQENSKKPTSSQVSRSVREHPKTPPPVLSKTKDALLFKVRQEIIQSELQQKLQRKEEKLTDIRTMESVCESVQDATSATNQTKVSAKVDPASLDEAAEPDFSTGMTVKELARMFSASKDQEPKNEEQKQSQVKLVARKFSASTVREAVIQPKEKDKKQGVEEGKLLALEFLATTARQTAVQPQENDKEQKLSQNEPPNINSATTPAIIEEPKPSVTTQCSLKKASNIQGDLQLQVNASVRKHPTTPPPVPPKKKHTLFKVKEGTFKSELQQKHEEKTTDRQAEIIHEKVTDTANSNTQVSAKEDPPSLNKAAQPDSSTGMKVKELAQMFSATTDQEPKNHRVDQKPSQTKLLAQRFSALTANKRAIQPKEKDKKTQMKPLTPRFSASTVKETVGKPKENKKEKHKLSQKQLPNSTNVATRVNPAATEATVENDPKPSCESAQLSDVCAGVKVKDLIWMFSAATTQEKDVQTKGNKR